MQHNLGGSQGNPGKFRDLFRAPPANTIYRTKPGEQGRLSLWRDSGTVVEEGLLHPLPEKEFVVAVGAAMGLIPDPLKKLEGTRIMAQHKGITPARPEYLFPLFRQPYDR